MKKTPLYDRHINLNAKIIDFGGWEMPVQYTNVIEEHRATREAAGIFDICHMGEIEIKGPGSFDLLQYAMTRNLAEQKINQMKLSLMINEEGGIIDDLTIYKLAVDHYMVVTNAVTREKDLDRLIQIRDRLNPDVEITDITLNTAKLDLQGPQSQSILQKIVSDSLTDLGFYTSVRSRILDIPVLISRSGYTGEDGFEIYLQSDKVGTLWDALLEVGKEQGLKPAGLGARDTLRLEAGMMLYGSEMSETVSPYEVIYGWLVDSDKNFFGRDALLRQKEKGFAKKLVGFEMQDRGIARHGYKIVGENGNEIGEVRSGTFSPTLNKAIGLGFVPTAFKEPGTEIGIKIRDNVAKAKVVKLPFYKREKRA
jgi:aminomethyltransferase